MNIYALKGHKVKCVSLSGSYNYDQEVAQEHLEIDKEYNVEKTIVHSWSTDVYLEEFPDIKFNSVFFEDINEQDEQLDKQHADYYRYH